MRAVMMLHCLLLLTLAVVVKSCDVIKGNDAYEGYYRHFGRLKATAVDCCNMCTSEAAAPNHCSFAVLKKMDSTDTYGECYLKNATTTTLKPDPACDLIVVKHLPPNPHPPAPPHPSPPHPSPPPPPLPQPKYKVILAEHSPTPVLSSANAKGSGASPCSTTFNPSYVEVAGGNTRGGVIVRTDGCKATQGRLSFAPCNVTTGVCGDLEPDYQAPASQGTQDPRVIYDPYTEYFYNFAYGDGDGAQVKADKCDNTYGACTVVLSRAKTPAVASSWMHVPGGTYPWHRNGCCHMQPVGQKTYCIFGESGAEGPGSGLGIAYTTDISKGQFTQVNWTAGVPGPNGVGKWMQPLGAEYEEIKLEAGAHMVQLDSGDLLHFYAAATPGWVADGNYTAGYIILDKDEPTKIIQRGSGQFLVPTFPYETLCHHGNTPDPGTCKYKGERNNVIFMCSATKIGPNKFRLFYGAGDGNVGTGVVEVSNL